LENVRQHGTARWVARCPSHKDKTPSLSIAELPDGRILVHDFGGCGVGDVLDSLGLSLSDLYPERLSDHLPAQRNRVHAHAAAQILKLMAHEALVVAIAAEAMTRGEALNEIDRQRICEAATVLKQAADYV
jgi:hypothetical protein